MSALAGYWPQSGALRVLGMFPENPSLVDRGLNDGVGELYTRAQDQGELVTGGDEISGFSPRALRQDFTIEALLSRLP